MPWYWSDEIAHTLVQKGVVSQETASELATALVAYRRDESSIEAAASGLIDDDEIPLAA